MIKKLLPVIIILVAAIVGGGGGFFAKSQTGKSANSEDQGEADSGHGKKEKKKKGGHGAEEEVGATSFMKFSRQFVVPVVERGKPKSMVILDINLEVDNTLNESVYTLEPRLRDAFLSRLLALSSQGMLPQLLEDVDKLEATKAALLETSREIIGDAALSILILDIGIQSY
ncbi:hypothetical protein [Hyphococcus sp.]|uniref:hypothetical protein n=1 Tax=Hyphococcus sp. TaxID=2038636 RepID=UPI00208B9884|nr:MAG: flagellar basal body-associated protein FliL [Marinicaulis sp.]